MPLRRVQTVGSFLASPALSFNPPQAGGVTEITVFVPQPETRNPKPETRNPKFQTQNPTLLELFLQTPNPKLFDLCQVSFTPEMPLAPGDTVSRTLHPEP